MNLAGTDIWSYGNTEFDTSFRTRASFEPVQDEAKRTTKWVEHTVEVAGYIGGDNVTTNAELLAIRQDLSVPGQGLQFQSRGYGTLNINSPGLADNVNDINFGPIPKVLSWKPVGFSKAAFIEWRCTTCIPECPNARKRGILSHNYEVSRSIDDSGLTTVTMSGHFEIVQTRYTNRTLAETSDQYLEFVTPPLMPGFRRHSTSNMDAAKRKTTYTITDTQVPYPLPNGVSHAEVTHTIRSSLSDGFAQWYHNISGTFTIPPGRSKQDVIPKILLLVFSRLKQRPAQPKPGTFVLPTGNKRALLITALEISDHVFLNKVGFSFQAKVLGTNLTEILNQGGLFTPVPGTSFQNWQTSMSVGANGGGAPWSARGVAYLTFTPEMDYIMDLCSPAITNHAMPAPKGLQGPGGPKRFNDGTNSDIDKENSWVSYECSAELLINNPVSIGKTMQAGINVALGLALPDITGLGEVRKASSKTFNVIVGALAAPIDHELQQLSPPTCRCLVKGRAIRLQYPISPPVVRKIGDVRVQNKGKDPTGLAVLEKFSSTPLKKGSAGGVPIYGLSWEMTYLLPRLPQGDVLTPANPSLELEGDG